jgi:hypothetical protein
MERKVQIYIEGERLELFDDEKISITSSIQNVQDISKTFTDLSQSFTVPASEHNNAIFKHFYENAIDNGYDYQVRRDARIEIDLIPFRTGKIQLEKANVKKGLAQSYSITFYGDLRTLQDYFGEDKLNTLDMSPYTHEYNGAEVQTRITSSSSYDIRYPLISSSRVWQYGGGGQQDISQNSHHIHYEELFPAVRISKVFEAIETKYDIDFQGLFLNDKRFTNCYLWLKNKDTFAFYSDRKALDFTAVSPTTGVGTAAILDRNVLKFNYDPENTIGAELPGVLKQIQFYVNAYGVGGADVTTSDVFIDVYENGNLIATVSGSFGNAAEYTGIVDWDGSLDTEFSFVGRAEGDVIVDYWCELNLLINGSLTDATGFFWDYALVTVAQNTFTKDLDISGNFPEMKISDFVAGVLKQFNLTCYGLSPTIFQIEPLEDWYSKGRIIDVTKHIDIDSIDYERVKLYKKIGFKHLKSATILNTQFAANNNREYGDLEQVYDYDGGEYVIQLPFENLCHQKFTGTDLQVGYSLDKTLAPIIPQPILLYMNEQKTVSFYFNNGTSTNHITSYMPFGQDLIYNSSKYTLNFGQDNSTFFLEPIERNIFKVYYYNYLANLYSKKQRLVYVKGLFPTPILTSLKMNDRILIRDKRYIINEIKTETTTGDVDLVLLNDFRSIKALNAPKTGKGVLTVTVGVLLPTGVTEVALDMGTTGVTASAATITTDTDIVFTYPVVTPSYTIIAENSDDLITEFNQYLRGEEGNTNVYDIELTYTNEDASTEVDILTLTQEV